MHNRHIVFGLKWKVLRGQAVDIMWCTTSERREREVGSKLSKKRKKAECTEGELKSTLTLWSPLFKTIICPTDSTFSISLLCTISRYVSIRYHIYNELRLIYLFRFCEE